MTRSTLRSADRCRTDDTLSRIAATCGFGTVDTLARAFRRALSITPAQYRERFRVR